MDGHASYRLLFARIAKRNPRSIEACRVNPGLETAAALKHKINSIVCEDTEGTDRKHESCSTTKSSFLKSHEIT